MHKHEKINKRLVENAFDFLKKAISEFPDSPKYSVINFYTAIELIFKSRLLNEHWALVVSKPEEANVDKFLRGEFQSVGLRDANNRLKSIAKDGITLQALEAFINLGNHRNRLIHFFHIELTSDKNLLDNIVIEQSTSWFYIHELLTMQWGEYFKEWKKEIRTLDSSMKKHRFYLETKYKKIQKEINIQRKNGSIFVRCSACNFISSKKETIIGQLSQEHCIVCDHSPTVLTFDCPHCSHVVNIYEDGYGECKKCKHNFEPEDLVDILIDDDAAHHAYKDGDDSFDIANCSFCDGYHTVIYYNNNYLCTNCFDVSDSVQNCQFCNDPNTGDMENSYWAGCNHCDGSSGWDSDKDD